MKLYSPKYKNTISFFATYACVETNPVPYQLNFDQGAWFISEVS